MYNLKFDEELIESGENLQEHYSNELLKYYQDRKIQYGNNFVLNFYVDDLNSEYKRVKELNVGKMSEILYVNIVLPYYYFLFSFTEVKLIIGF